MTDSIFDYDSDFKIDRVCFDYILYTPSFPVNKIYFTQEYLKKRKWKGVVIVQNLLIKPLYHNSVNIPHFYGFKEKVFDYAMFHGITTGESAAIHWLKNNCIGQWDRIGRYGVEFEFIEDAILYRLIWED